MIIEAGHKWPVIIPLVLFQWIIKQDYKNKYLVTRDWSQYLVTRDWSQST